MHSRLPRCLPNIYADVESVGRVLRTRQLMGTTEKVKNRDLLLCGHFEEVSHVALRNDDDVTTTQRVAVRAHIGQFVLGQNRPSRAEFAFPGIFHDAPFGAA